MFQPSSRFDVSGNAGQLAGSVEQSDNMPGTVKLPGAVPTPFQNMKEHTNRHGNTQLLFIIHLCPKCFINNWTEI